jgi:hypothetical protein
MRSGQGNRSVHSRARSVASQQQYPTITSHSLDQLEQQGKNRRQTRPLTSVVSEDYSNESIANASIGNSIRREVFPTDHPFHGSKVEDIADIDPFQDPFHGSKVKDIADIDPFHEINVKDGIDPFRETDTKDYIDPFHSSTVKDVDAVDPFINVNTADDVDPFHIGSEVDNDAAWQIDDLDPFKNVVATKSSSSVDDALIKSIRKAKDRNQRGLEVDAGNKPDPSPRADSPRGVKHLVSGQKPNQQWEIEFDDVNKEETEESEVVVPTNPKEDAVHHKQTNR